MSSEFKIDKDLIERIQGGEMHAFHLLVDRYKERAVRIAYSATSNLADAQDVAQEAFVRIFKNIKNFKFNSSFSTWFYRILINLCRDFLRRKSSSRICLGSKTEGDQVYELKDDGANPAQGLIITELDENIQAAIEELPDKQRIVFNLKYKEGMKIREIAEVMGVSVSTIKVHLFRAVRSLQKKLRPYLNEGGRSC
ncbi:MAG: sigma-70 family RNA polymerase sigma factor [PVC group bacterium]|nr:sigma-70 family RNA polymerase sigma factor [PVC group bacterium]